MDRLGRLRSTRALLAGLIAVSALTMTVDARSGGTGPLAGIGGALLTLISPLQRAVAAVTSPIGSFVTSVTRLPELRSENDELRARVAELEQRVATEGIDRERLAELEGLLDLEASLGASTTGVAAQVIASGLSNFEWTITIDKGSSDGIEVGMPVLSEAGVVGVIVQVGLASSVVQTLLDPATSVAGRLPGGVTGLVEGQGAGDLRMGLVDPGSSVTAGDVVVTAGFSVPGAGGSVFPQGILIGRVSRVLPGDASPERFVEIRPTVDFAALSVVLVVTPPTSG